MLGFVQIALTTKCNLSCWHCPMSEYRNTNPNFPLNNKELIPWLKGFNPREVVVELTGGEPALYDGIEELCLFLSRFKYPTLIKTNGLIEIPKFEGIKRVAAFHRLDNPPKYFDEILIIDKIDREEKERICKENGWKYQVIGYNKETIDDVKHKFTGMIFVNPAGHPIKCPAFRPRELVREDGIDYGRINHVTPHLDPICDNCKIMVDAWRFLDEKVKLRAYIPKRF